MHRDLCYGQNLSQFNIHELSANKTPKHPSKLKKNRALPFSSLHIKINGFTSFSFDHWTEITFQRYKVHHSSSSYFCLTWTMSTKLSKQKNTMSFSRKLGKNEEKIQLAHILIICIQKISFSSLTFQFRRIFFFIFCPNDLMLLSKCLLQYWLKTANEVSCVFHLYLYSFLAH